MNPPRTARVALDGAPPRAPQSTFSKRAVGWLIAIGVISFAIRLGMGAFGEDLAEPSTAVPSAFSYSAIGHRALVDFLEKRGIPALIRQDPSGAHGGPNVPELFVEPDLAAMEAQGSALEALIASARRRGAPVVVVLPKWEGQPDFARFPPWVDEVELRPVRHAAEVLEATGIAELEPVEVVRTGRKLTGCETDGRAIEASLGRAQLLELSASDDRVQSVIACDGGVLVAVYVDEPRPDIWIVSDPDLLSNHGLARPGNAAIVESLFVRGLGAEALVIDEAVHGFRRRISLMTQLARFPLVFCTLHGTLVLGLVLWSGMARFGKPRPLPPGRLAGKEALIDNTAQLLAAGGYTSDTLARYFAETVRAVAAHHMQPPELPEKELKARLQTITRTREIRFRVADVDQAIAGLAAETRRGSEHRAVRIASAIHRWRQEMTK